MAAPLIPWEPCNIPEEIQEELNRRKTVRSFNYVDVQNYIKRLRKYLFQQLGSYCLARSGKC